MLLLFVCACCFLSMMLNVGVGVRCWRRCLLLLSLARVVDIGCCRLLLLVVAVVVGCWCRCCWRLLLVGVVDVVVMRCC